ncbi:MAG: hypothetical protein REI94_10085 [Moraxellaceae bacterium]|nr:hypothetical protein [Moraxellaceae bacterium]
MTFTITLLAAFLMWHALCVSNHRMGPHRRTPALRRFAWALLATAAFGLVLAPFVSPQQLQRVLFLLLLAIAIRAACESRRWFRRVRPS